MVFLGLVIGEAWARSSFATLPFLDKTKELLVFVGVNLF